MPELIGMLARARGSNRVRILSDLADIIAPLSWAPFQPQLIELLASKDHILSDGAPTNNIRGILPLLDDVTPIVYSHPSHGQEWRICDRAALTIAILLKWEDGFLSVVGTPERRVERMNRVRAWAELRWL